MRLRARDFYALARHQVANKKSFMKTFIGCCAVYLLLCQAVYAQVDTTFIYRTNTPYGTLDLRIAKSLTRYYYLQENKTFSYRESAPGVKTNTYTDMTSWDSSPYSEGNLREKNGSYDYFVLNYRLLFPANYSQAYSKGYPLIVMMHGAGERGNCWDSNCFWDTRLWNPLKNYPAAPTTTDHPLLNNDYNLLHGGSQHLAARNLAGNMLPDDPNLPSNAFPGFVLFPQNLNGWTGTNVQDAIKLIRLVVKKYNIDPDRIYVHGLSNGGVATYEVIKRAPWLFAAALPMSAPNEAGIITKGLTPTVANIPLWIFQGGKDTAPTPGRTRGYVKSFRDAGMIIRYTEYSNLGHGVWNTAYAEPDFFSWMLGKNKANIHLYANISTICQNNGKGVQMELADGFYAYQWERDGVLLSDATGAIYVADTPGTYRARFSRIKNPGPADWNQWSDPVVITSQTMEKPVVAQTGTVVLRGLDNYGSALLHAEGEYPHYYWYKNGVLQNLPGSVDDTVSYVKFGSGDCSSGTCVGNGIYTLVVASIDNCPSPPSDGKYVFFNNQAPINIPAPTNFTGTPLSDARVSLSWTDVSTTENGFEIWRRRQTGATTFTVWAMAPITQPDQTSMIDKGLMPSSTYQYKIRAAGNTGRSNYTPSASNQFVTVITTDDYQNPTVPQNLTAEATAIREITLRWDASSDNTGIKEYQIYYGSDVISTGSRGTTYVLKDLPLNTDYTFTVRAVDLGNNLSAVSNQAAASTYVNGLFYEHSTGAFTDLDLIDWNFAEFRGKVDNFTLEPRTQEDYFNFEFEGYLYLVSGGAYQFQVTSDDAGRLTLDDVILVDNDGQHATRTVTGQTISLTSGAHFINVKYFDYINSQNLTIRYKGPDTGNNWVAIPDQALRSGSSSVTNNTMMALSAETTNLSTSPEPDETDNMVIDLYPNPSKPYDHVNLQVNGGKGPVNIKLVDMMGQSQYENILSVEELANGIQITPPGQLSRGIYILIIHQGKKTRKQTLIVNE